MPFYLRNLCFLFLLTLCSNVSFGQISGYVFKDFNANGVRDSTAIYNDQGRIGSKVYAYNKVGALVGTGTTNLFGQYSITVPNGDYRVEFEVPADYYDGFSGPNYTSRSNVTFVTAPATKIDLGIYFPSDYCETTPPVATVCYSIGQGKEDEKAIVTFP